MVAMVKKEVCLSIVFFYFLGKNPTLYYCGLYLCTGWFTNITIYSLFIKYTLLCISYLDFIWNVIISKASDEAILQNICSWGYGLLENLICSYGISYSWKILYVLTKFWKRSPGKFDLFSVFLKKYGSKFDYWNIFVSKCGRYLL